MNKYKIVIPGRGTYQVESESELSDVDAYEAALRQSEQEGIGTRLGRAAGVAGRAMLPTITGAKVGGALVGAPGAIAGSVTLPVADLLYDILNLGYEPLTGKKLQTPSSMLQRGLTAMGVPGAPETQSTAERVTTAGLQAGAGLPQQIKSLTQLSAEAASPMVRGLASQMAQAPGTQAMVSPVAASTGQLVSDVTGSPLAGLAATLAVGSAGAIRKPQKEVAPSSTYLERVADDRYQMLKDSGIEIDQNKFVSDMSKIAANLRTEGYQEKAFPKIAGAIEELQNINNPKDWTELQALRKMIKNGQASNDPAEKRIASILLDEYDNYLLSLTKGDLIAGKQIDVGGVWKDAREAYSKMKKAEIFENMLENAQLDKSKFTASGSENSLAQQLRQLSKNEKKMRLFTQEEQDAIKAAAKGGSLQNLLKFVGRFAPTGPVSGMFAGGATVYEPTIGIPATLTAAQARRMATTKREESIADLIARMQLGRSPQVTGGPFRAVAPTTIRGLLSQQQLDQELGQFVR